MDGLNGRVIVGNYFMDKGLQYVRLNGYYYISNEGQYKYVEGKVVEADEYNQLILSANNMDGLRPFNLTSGDSGYVLHYDVGEGKERVGVTAYFKSLDEVVQVKRENEIFLSAYYVNVSRMLSAISKLTSGLGDYVT